jgi:t-SNARE complex subunit (syntaxin)
LFCLIFNVLQVNRAVDYVGGGTKALVEAKTLQKSKRKWCCCAIILLLIIVIIVVVVVSGSRRTPDALVSLPQLQSGR